MQILVLLLLFQATAHSAEFDFKAALHYALEHSPKLNSAQRDLNISVLEDKSARAVFWPSLDLSLVNGFQDTSPTSRINTGTVGNTATSTAVLGLTENLYDNGIANIKSDIAEIKLKQSQLSLQKTRNQICLDVALSYLRFSDLSLTEKIQLQQLNYLKKQSEQTNRGFQQGFKPRKDVLRFETQVRRAEIDYFLTQNEIARAAAELRKTLGDLSAGEESINFKTDSVVPNKVHEIGKLDFEKHLDYRISVLQKESNSLTYDLSRTRNMPEFFINSNVSYQNDFGTGNNVDQRSLVSWNALLTIKYNLFDWGIRRREKAIAYEKMFQSNNTQEQTLIDLKQQLGSVTLDLQQNERNLKIAEELLDLEKKNSEILQKEYYNGKVQFLDFVTGLKDLADAEVKSIHAFSDYKKTFLTIKYHEGNLYEYLQK